MANLRQISTRTSQAYALGAPATPAGVNQTKTFTSQREIMLGRLSLQEAGPAIQGGQVTNISVQGASIMCSDSNASVACFSPFAVDAGQNFIGVPVPAQGVLLVQATLDNAGSTLLGTCYTDPWDQSTPMPSPSQLGISATNYVFGMGRNLAVPAGAQTVLTAVALRDTIVGELVLSARDSGAFFNVDVGCTVDFIAINNTEQLASNRASQLSLASFGVQAQDIDMRVMQSFVPMNGIIQIGITNLTGANIDVEGHWYCTPA